MRLKAITNNVTQGFTLVEIIISVGIMGLISAVVVPGILNGLEVQTQRSAAKQGYASLLSALELLSNDWDVPAADRLGINPRSSTTTAGIFDNLRYRLKPTAFSPPPPGTAVPNLHPVAYNNIMVLPSNIMLRNVRYNGAATPSTVDIDLNGGNTPNVLGRDIFRLQFNYSSDPVAGLNPFDARISTTMTPAQRTQWNQLTDTKDANNT
jgi:prepilin-type N-terminal cleavage/methylation domain-containing protein